MIHGYSILIAAWGELFGRFRLREIMDDCCDVCRRRPVSCRLCVVSDAFISDLLADMDVILPFFFLLPFLFLARPVPHKSNSKQRRRLDDVRF
jgi:hypothetical protein